jgi:hypothetical protein
MSTERLLCSSRQPHSVVIPEHWRRRACTRRRCGLQRVCGTPRRSRDQRCLHSSRLRGCLRAEPSSPSHYTDGVAAHCDCSSDTASPCPALRHARNVSTGRQSRKAASSVSERGPARSSTCRPTLIRRVRAERETSCRLQGERRLPLLGSTGTTFRQARCWSAP